MSNDATGEQLKTVLSNCDAKRDHNYREGADSFTITTREYAVLCEALQSTPSETGAPIPLELQPSQDLILMCSKLEETTPAHWTSTEKRALLGFALMHIGYHIMRREVAPSATRANDGEDCEPYMKEPYKSLYERPHDKHGEIKPFPFLEIAAIILADKGFPTASENVRIAMDALRERLASLYVKTSGKTVHSSDCATSIAPAEDPGPCDCDMPVSATREKKALEEIYRLTIVTTGIPMKEAHSKIHELARPFRGDEPQK
jgi:hypothetical protein